MRSLAAGVALGTLVLLSACGGGSGKSGTDVQVTGAGPSAQVEGGGVAVFVMTVTNHGPYDASSLTIQNELSQVSASTVVISCTASGGAVCPTSTINPISVPALPSGGTLVFQITGTSILGASGNLSDTMSVSVGGSGDLDPSNNTVTVYGPVVSNDVSVVASGPPGPLLNGPATFTMVVANAGPNDATNVVLTTTSSTNVSFVPANISCVPNPNTGPNATPVAAVPTLQSDGTLLTTLIPATGSLFCTIPVTVADATNGFAVVSMSATSAGDSHTSNNSSSASVSATLVNDLSVVVSSPSKGSTLISSPAVFTAVISNAGPSTASNVVITNTLGPTDLASSLSLASPISCVPTGGASVPVLQTDGTVLIASLPATGTVPVQVTCTISVNVPEGTNGLVSDTVSLSTTDDPKTANNTSQASSQISLVNNVGVSAGSAPSSVPGGSATAFSFSVTNTGPSTAYNVSLTSTLTGQISYSNTAAPFTCVVGSGFNDTSPGAFTVTGATATAVAPSISVGDTLTCSVPVVVGAGVNGTVAATFAATAAFDQLTVNNTATASTIADSTTLSISETASAPTIAAGSSGSFSATVANPRGLGTANNVSIQWTPVLPSGISGNPFGTPTCTALGGATCPSQITSSQPITVSSLLPAASLVFTFPVTSMSTDRGAIVNNLSVSSVNDPNVHSATATLTVVDPRNGTYSVFGSDGQPYSMTIDFDSDGSTQASSYTITGNGISDTHQFALDSAGSGDYVAADNSSVRFRVTQDMIVGSDLLSTGTPLPYVAARSFVSSVAQIGGSFDLATRNVPAGGSGGAPVTHAGTALISGNTLSICQNDGGPVATVSSCPVVLASYTLSTSGNNLFKAVNNSASTLQPFQFYVVNTGAAKVLLSANISPDQSSQQFVIGLTDSQGGLALGTVRGGSTGVGSTVQPDWVSIGLASTTSTTCSASYSAISAIGGTTNDPLVNLAKVSNGIGGPFSICVGQSAQNSLAQIYVMQSTPLAVAFGSNGGAASGLLEIALP